MDFKGKFATIRASIRCHPLTVLDDHSRFSLVLQACADEREQTVRSVLTEAFRRYGLPAAMLMDNGSPWGAAGAQPFTGLSLWLIRLGIRVAHGRPYHPQTQGKDERFHRTLKFEVLRHFNFTSLEHCQREFDSFRDRYNLVRPHDALGLATPVSRYRPSPIPFPESLPPVEYPDDLEVRKVQAEGWFSYRGKAFRVSKALRGFPIALRQSESSATHCARSSSATSSSTSSTSITLSSTNDPNSKCVTYVLAHLLPMSPVRTAGRG
jgi:hypothetical protein